MGIISSYTWHLESQVPYLTFITTNEPTFMYTYYIRVSRKNYKEIY